MFSDGDCDHVVSIAGKVWLSPGIIVHKIPWTLESVAIKYHLRLVIRLHLRQHIRSCKRNWKWHLIQGRTIVIRRIECRYQGILRHTELSTQAGVMLHLMRKDPLMGKNGNMKTLEALLDTIPK